MVESARKMAKLMMQMAKFTRFVLKNRGIALINAVEGGALHFKHRYQHYYTCMSVHFEVLTA